MEQKLKKAKLWATIYGIGVINFLILMMHTDKSNDLGGMSLFATVILFSILAAREWAKYTELYVDFRIQENQKNGE